MENINKMRKRHEKEIKKLQKYCNHPTSEWIDYMWAPGHFAGKKLICDFCEKELDSK